MAAVLAARVTGVDASGALVIQGRRQIAVNGSLEQITVNGSVMPDGIIDGKVAFEKMADARLVFDTNVYPSGEVLREGDIVYVDRTPPALPDPAAEGVAVDQIEEESPQPGTEAVPAVPRIEDERQRALLREYMNRFLQLLFSTESTAAPR